MEKQKTFYRDSLKESKRKKTFMEYMGDKKLVNRWLILKVILAGAFVGAVLGVLFAFTGVIVI